MIVLVARLAHPLCFPDAAPSQYDSCGTIVSLNEGFDFSSLLDDAIANEGTLGEDCTEGYPFEPVATMLPSTDNEGATSAPESVSTPLPSRPATPMLPLGNAVLSPEPQLPAQQVSKPRPSLSQTQNKKRKSKSLKKLKRQQDIIGNAHGGRLTVRRHAALRHILPSVPVETSLQMKGVSVTKPGFTAKRYKKQVKGTFTLSELVGEGSKFGFKLKCWDGW